MSQEPPQPSNSVPEAESTSPAAKPGLQKLRSLGQMLKQLWEIGLAFVPVLLNLLVRLWELTGTILQWILRQWTALLPQIRRILPAPWNTKIPDFLITAIAAALLTLVLWIPITQPFSHSPAVADQPEQAADHRPPVEPIPDPTRIAAIQEQMAEVTTEYAEGLIQAVQINFLRSRLTVSVGDDWYALDRAQRDRLANELLRRSKKLAFDQLEIADLEGTLVARSPVVGTNMVVLEAVKQAG
jgi:hypothetical protein